MTVTMTVCSRWRWCTWAFVATPDELGDTTRHEATQHHSQAVGQQVQVGTIEGRNDEASRADARRSP
jgi:hypothetical protein